jgi:prepilin-type N-terminal cleavage/methylation domain-containing protein
VRGRGGFTIVELMVVVTIIGVLAAIGLPKFRDVQRRAVATQMLGDLDAIRHAALSFYVDSGYFPPDAGTAEVPRNLGAYLPNGFSMRKPEWTMDYENWPAAGGGPAASTLGVSFTTPDPRLGMTALRLAGDRPGFASGNEFTFLITF